MFFDGAWRGLNPLCEDFPWLTECSSFHKVYGLFEQAGQPLSTQFQEWEKHP
jgi:hypothetical protein